LLLAASTVSDMGIAGGESAVARQFRAASEILGNKNVALSLAAAVAIATLWWSKRGDRNATTAAVQRALATGGTVLLITAAGGAFGQVIRQTDIAGEVVRWIPQQGTGITVLLIGFFITALVRVAQGSATVAMITAVSILAPVVGAMELPFHTVYVMLAIGCGSKPLPWMNDSGFWVVGRMSGFTPIETLKTESVTLTVMGFVGLLVTIFGAIVTPFK
jgi:GntP family gluconate:H+ symporter